MDICELAPLAPTCLATSAASGALSVATGGALTSIGDAFAAAAASVMDAVFVAIATTTTVDLSAAYVTGNAAALGAVAGVLVVALFVVQVVTAAVRREPGGLGRAVTGAALAVLGTAVAASVVQSLLVVVDALCDGIAALAGTSIEDAARTLLDATLLANLAQVGGGGAALMIVFGLLFIAGAVLTLGTLLVRQALIVIAVVVAPLALAGGTARLTSGWVRRWAQVTLALVLSKLAIVVVLVVAVGMVGDGDGVGALLSGLILLLLAALAPWACFKVLDFAGTHIATEWHRATNGSTLAIANQGRYTAQSLMRTVAPVLGGAGAAAGAGAAGVGGAAGGGAGRRPAGGGWPGPSPTPGAGGSGAGAGGTTSGGARPGPAPSGPGSQPQPAPAAAASGSPSMSGGPAGRTP